MPICAPQIVLQDTEQKYGELADVGAMIGSLRDRVATWRQDFLTQALSIGSDAFKSVLADQGKLWADACARYGTGVPGYKRDLAVMFQRFFETSEPDPARAAVETRLTDAWMSTIIEPLIAATRGGTSINIHAAGSPFAGARSARRLDDTRQCRTDGEINVPLRQGLINEKDIAGEIGGVITGRRAGAGVGRRDHALRLYRNSALGLGDGVARI